MKELKKRETIRVYPSDKLLLIKLYGSLQKALDALIKKEKSNE